MGGLYKSFREAYSSHSSNCVANRWACISYQLSHKSVLFRERHTIVSISTLHLTCTAANRPWIFWCTVFKSNFSKEVAKFTVQYPSVSITKRTFPSFLKNAYEISCSVETIKSSFRATGTWPVNRFKVDHDLFNPSEIYTDATSHNSDVEIVDVEMKVNSTVASVD